MFALEALYRSFFSVYAGRGGRVAVNIAQCTMDQKLPHIERSEPNKTSRAIKKDVQQKCGQKIVVNNQKGCKQKY
jgi:hypothetical protein